MLSEDRAASAAHCFAVARRLRMGEDMPLLMFFNTGNRRRIARKFAAHARLQAREAGKYMPRSVVHNGGKRRVA